MGFSGFRLVAGAISIALGISTVHATIVPGGVTIRDRIGGEDANGNPPGFYLSGTGSRPIGFAFGPHLRPIDVGAIDLEYNDSGTWRPFVTYTLDPSQPIGLPLNTGGNQSETYEAVSLPQFKLNGTLSLNPFDVQFMRILFSNAFEESLTSRTKAAAFQFLLWELMWDTRVDFTQGSIRLANSASNAPIAAQAHAWYNLIKDGDWNNPGDVVALQNPCFGPMVTLVPTPGAAVLGIIATSIMLLRRRR